jgi:hypothetical protein
MDPEVRSLIRATWPQRYLNRIPGYVLARMKGEALALHAALPESWVSDQTSIVIGYIEAYDFYPEGEFPWGRVAYHLKRIRSRIGWIIKSATMNSGKMPAVRSVKRAA